MSKTYLGIDPSFSKTGLCHIDTTSKYITFDTVSPEGTNQTYKDTIYRSRYISESIKNLVSSDESVSIILEQPMVRSQMASSLGILSGILATELIDLPTLDSFYTINPRVISSLNSNYAKKNKLDKKKASYEVGKKVLEYLQETYNYSITVINNKVTKTGKVRTRKISHDEMEAFLMVVLLLKHLNKLNTEDIDAIRKINNKFNTDYEVNLIKGD